MRNYEVVVIFHPDLDEAALNALLDKVKGWITEAGGVVEKLDIWGKRRMAYSMRKQREGQYVYMEAQMPPTFTNELEHNMRLSEPIMRFLITAR